MKYLNKLRVNKMFKFILGLFSSDKETAQQRKFRLARESKARRLLIEDQKRNAKDHPLD